MCLESLVVNSQAASTRRVTARTAALRCGATRTSEPQADPTSRPGARATRFASHASVPC
jgi:hypothetical protein